MTAEATTREFTQLVVWPGTNLGSSDPEAFVEWVADEFNGTRAKFAEVVTTLPGNNGPGGRTDLLFFIHHDDVPKFAAPRLRYEMQWWEDCLANGIVRIYPDEVVARYPSTWNAGYEDAPFDEDGHED